MLKKIFLKLIVISLTNFKGEKLPPPLFLGGGRQMLLISVCCIVCLFVCFFLYEKLKKNTFLCNSC